MACRPLPDWVRAHSGNHTPVKSACGDQPASEDLKRWPAAFHSQGRRAAFPMAGFP